MGVSLGDAEKHPEKTGNKEMQGAILLSVRAGSPAQRRRLRAGDVILGLAYKRIRRRSDVLRVAAQLVPGSPCHVMVWRAGRTYSFKMFLPAH